MFVTSGAEDSRNVAFSGMGPSDQGTSVLLSCFLRCGGLLSKGTLVLSVTLSRTGPMDQGRPVLSVAFCTTPGGSLQGGSETGQAGEVGGEVAVDTLGDLSDSLISSDSCATETVIRMPLFQGERSEVRLLLWRRNSCIDTSRARDCGAHKLPLREDAKACVDFDRFSSCLRV